MAHITESGCFTVIVILVGSVDAKLCVTLHSVFGEKHTILHTGPTTYYTQREKHEHHRKIPLHSLSRQNLNNNHSITNNAIFEAVITHS